MLGGLGNPAAEAHANHLVTRLARLVNGEPCFLPAPGVVGSASSANVLLKDPYVQQTVSLFRELTIALVGIGSVEPSLLVASSGNVFSNKSSKFAAAGRSGTSACDSTISTGGKFETRLEAG